MRLAPIPVPAAAPPATPPIADPATDPAADPATPLANKTVPRFVIAPRVLYIADCLSSLACLSICC